MDKTFEYIVSQEEKGERLDHFLALKKGIDLSRSQIHRLIDDGYVEVNKEALKASYKIKADDRIIVTVPPPQELEVKPENIPLDIVYEDSDLIVVNKPRGMVVHLAPGHSSGTLVNALLYHCKDLSGIGGVTRPGVVHRLDKETSGLIVVAKSDLAHQKLAKQFSNKQVFKQYLAIVHGVIKEDQGTIEAKIGRHPKHRKKMAIVPGDQQQAKGVKGREAVTGFKVLERFKNYSLVALTLKTGRTHQIRVHLTSIGHAIVGDPVYGHRREEFSVSGQLLHAAKLGFVHPRTKEYLEFSKEIPGDMAAVLKKLRRKSGVPEPPAGR